MKTLVNNVDLDYFKSRFIKQESGMETASEELKRLVHMVLLRRTKDIVSIQLPSKTEQLINLQFSTRELTKYEMLQQVALRSSSKRSGNWLLKCLVKFRLLCNHFNIDITDQSNDSFDDMLDAMQELKMDEEVRHDCYCCSNTVYLKYSVHYCENCIKKMDVSEAISHTCIFSTKIDAAIKVICSNANAGKKSIVFSSFTSSLDKLEYALRRCKVAFERFDGSMDRQARVNSLSRFQIDPTCSVLCASLKATSVGLNITCASEVIFLDLWFNPFVEDQAIARVHRIGQRNQVRVTKFKIENTIEEKIIDLQEKKRGLADDLLSKQSKPTKSELQYILGLVHDINL
jgi:SNF2 family DNA or RNA helicase